MLIFKARVTDSSVLKNNENKPIHWLHKPTDAEVTKFEETIKGYEKPAKKVRYKLSNKWIQEELESSTDTVTKLQWLRTSRSEGDIWPCYKCQTIGETFYASVVFYYIKV